MPPERTLFLIEDIDTTPRRRLFTVLDVPVSFTPLAWLQIPLLLTIGLVLTVLLRSVSLPMHVLNAIIYSVLLASIVAIHDFGHIFVSKRINAPMEELVVTGTRPVSLYSSYGLDLPGEVHLARAVGGPLANFATAAVALFIYRNILDSHFLAVLGYGNLIFMLITVLPIPSLDGQVIWRELPNLRRKRY